MNYLLDVNALLALLLSAHSHHGRTLGWVQKAIRKERVHLLTCPITEIGFMRILCQSAGYGHRLSEARELLERAKGGRIVPLLFKPDDLSAVDLPGWVMGPKQITDGYLLELARKHEAVLATLDEKIPGAFLIPQLR